MPRETSGKVVVDLLGLLWAAALFAGTDPTPAEIVAGWQALAGSTFGKVVYWESNEIRVMNLTTGTYTTVLTGVTRSASETAVGAYPQWSPDGTRILFYCPNGYGSQHWKMYKVVNENGTNLKTVSETPPWTYGCCSWYDNNSVVVQDDAPEYIVKVTIDASNNPGARQALVNFAPYGGTGREWISASGNFVAWTDWGANGSAGNRSLVRNFITGQEMEVAPRTDDACTIRLKEDGSGTCVYCHNSHFDAETRSFAVGIAPAGTLIDDNVLRPNSIKFEMPNWANNPDYMCVMDDRQYSDPAVQKSYIIKLHNDADTGEFLFLGYGMWGADLWVDSTPPDTEAPTVSVTKAVLAGTVSDSPNSPPATVSVAGVDYDSSTGNWISGDVTFTKGVNIPVIATDASYNTRTVNVNINWP